MYMYIVPVNEYSYVVYLHICFIFQQFKTSMHMNVTYNSMFTMSLKSEDLIKKKTLKYPDIVRYVITAV